MNSDTSDVNGVIITGDLDRRWSRSPDYQAENQALTSLAEAMSTNCGTVLQRLVELAMELTRSDSAGISLLEQGGENGTFRWVATAGAWSPYRDGTMPREASPCGEVIAREAVLLMKNPERSFPALLQAEPGINEGLLAPFNLGGVPGGTVWTIKHSPDDHFEAEDARLIKSLARFASAAHQMVQALQLAEAAGQHAEVRVQQLVALAEISTEFFGTCNMEFKPIYGNAAAMRMVGLTDLDEVKRTPLLEFFFPEDLAFITDEFIPRVLREGQAKVEIRFRHFVTGEPVWVDYNLVVLKDAMGRMTGFGTVTHNLTERKLTETALRVSEARFRALATVGSSSIYRMSADWRELRQLEGAAFLPNTDEATTDWVDTYIPPDERPRVRAAIDRAIAAKDTFELEHRVLRRDGTIGWTFSRAIPLLDKVGEISEWFGAATDVTVRVKADQSFTRLFSASPAPFLVLKPDAPHFTIDKVNDAYLSATMRTRDEVVGRGIFDAFPDNPSDETTGGVSILRASLEQVLASRQPDRLPGLRYDVAWPDGIFEERWWSPVNSAMIDDNGEVEALIHNANDVTEERRSEIALRESEGRHAFLLKLSDTLRPLRDPFELQKATMRLVVEHLDVIRASYFQLDLDHDGFVLTASYERGALPLPDHMRVSDFAPDLADRYRKGQIFVLEDAEADVPAELERAVYRAIGVRAAVGVPLVKDGLLLGVFGVHSATPRHWSDSEVQFLKDVADRIWTTVDRAHSELALRQGEERQAFLFKLSDAIRVLGDPLEIQTAALRVLGEHLGVNRAFYNVIDEERDAYVIHRTYTDGVAPLTGHFRLSNIQWTAELAGSGQIVVFYDASADPRLSAAERAAYRAMEVAAGVGVPLIKDGRLVAGLGVHHATPRRWTPEDIELIRETAERTWAAVEQAHAETACTWAAVEQAHAETALQSAAARDAFRVQLTDALRGAANAEEAQRAAMHVLGDHFQASRVMFGEGDKGSTETFTNHCEYCRAPAKPSSVGQHRWDAFGLYVETELLAGRTLVVDDVQTHPGHSPLELAAYEAIAIRAYLAVPLVRQNRIMAYLVVNHTTTHTWTPDEIALAEETAERIWSTVVRARADAALRESEAKYRTLFDSIDQGFCIAEGIPDEMGRMIDRRFLEVNPAFETATGLGGMVGKLMSQFTPRTEAKWIKAFDHVVQTGEPRRIEEFNVDTGRWYSANHALIGGPGSRLVGIVFDDITERKRAERALRESAERQTFLLKLSDALRPFAKAMEILATTTRLLGNHMGADRVMYAEVDGALGEETGTVHGQYVRLLSGGTDSIALFPEHFTFGPFGAHTMAARHRGETLVVANIDANPGFTNSERTAWVVANVRAAVVASLAKGGRLVAEFGVHSSVPRDWTRAEVSLVEEVAERTWAAAERARVEAALREREERLGLIVESARDYAIFTIDPRGLITDWREGAEAVFGWSRAEAIGMNAREIFTSEDRKSGELEKKMECAFDKGRAPDVRWHLRKDGSRVFIDGVLTRLGGGATLGYLKIGQDVTDRHRAEAALSASEGRLQTLMEGIPQLVWRSSDAGLWTWASRQWLDFTSQTQEMCQGLGWLDVIHPDDQKATKLSWGDSCPHGLLDVEFRVRRAADGAWIWHHTRSVPVQNEQGRIVEWLGTTTDVQMLKEFQERQSVLVAELQHRTRNLIAIVRSTSDKTARVSADLTDFRARFRDRLDALARVQGLLSHLSDSDRVTFDKLIKAEMIAMDSDMDKVTLKGPLGIRLRSSTVQTLALALHELATNAVKYGALGQPDARLAVTWRWESPGEGGEPWLHIEWRETGVIMAPIGAAPRSTGHGRELIERALPYQLSAKTSYELGRDGVYCTISLAVSSNNS